MHVAAAAHRRLLAESASVRFFFQAVGVYQEISNVIRNVFSSTAAAVGAALFTLATVPASATIVSGSGTSGLAFDAGGTLINLTVAFASNPNNTAEADNFNRPNLCGFNQRQNMLPVNAL